MKNQLPDNLFPDYIKNLLHAMSGVGFFERSVVIGSWVMLIYQELYGPDTFCGHWTSILLSTSRTQKAN